MTLDPFARAVMVAYCKWDPTEVVTDKTVYLNGNGTPLLTLPSLYVTDVSEVVITDRAGSVSTATVGVGAVDLEWSEDGCLECTGCRFSVFPAGRRNVAVTYSGGYETVPDTLQPALDSIAKRAPSATSGVQKRKLLNAEIQYAASLMAGQLLITEQMVLDQFRIMQAG
ncbi:MAG TPA: hypothetical protein VJ851_00660 [Jatrophihabitans sp.]|nr:hypothetical protein [Jatrophihabitans sp.]